MTINWDCKTFEELSPYELYKILQLRSEIFVVEQNCVFQDMDDLDQRSHHLMAWEGPFLIAYTRLLPPGLAFDQPSIGRVVTAAAIRKEGIGRELMKRSIEKVYALFGKQPIKIGAQVYLRKFYESLGFDVQGEVYVEDHIDHIKMLKI